MEAGTPANVAVTIVDPVVDGIVHELVEIEVEITSDFEIDTVVADLDGNVESLSFDGSSWTGEIDITGTTWGPIDLSVTATDVFDNEGSSMISVMFDLPPVLSVTFPIDYDVIEGNTFAVQASCTDDGPGGCTNMTLRNSASGACTTGTTLASSTGGSINTTATYAFAVHGTREATCLRGFDSAGQSSIGHLARLWFFDHPLLEEVEAASGLIVEVTEDRLLFALGGPTGLGFPIGIRVRAAGTEEIIFDSPTILMDDAMLTSAGLFGIFKVLDGGWLDYLYDYRSDGTLFDLGAQPAIGDLKTAGPYVSYLEHQGFGEWDLLRRNLDTDTTETIVFDVASSGHQLLPDGSMIYSDSTTLGLVHFDGVAHTPIVSDPPLDYRQPRLDDEVLAYVKRRFTLPATNEYTVAVFDDGVETEFNPLGVNTSNDFRLAGNWVAFERAGAMGQDQVWLRSPDGTETQVTFFSGNSNIGHLNDRGQLTFNTVMPDGLHEFLHTGYTAQPVDLGLQTSSPTRWLGDQLYKSMGRKLFKLRIDYFADGFESGDLATWDQVVN